MQWRISNNPRRDRAKGAPLFSFTPSSKKGPTTHRSSQVSLKEGGLNSVPHARTSSGLPRYHITHRADHPRKRRSPLTAASIFGGHDTGSSVRTLQSSAAGTKSFKVRLRGQRWRRGQRCSIGSHVPALSPFSPLSDRQLQC